LSEVWQRGVWQDCLRVETVLAMLTLVSHFTQAMHRVWASCEARLACTLAACHVLVSWQSVQPNAAGFVPLSRAELRL